MSTLLEAVRSIGCVRLGVVTAYPGLRDMEFVETDIEYMVLGQPKRLPILSFRRYDLHRCAAIVKKWRPDLIHIHGTERFYGLLANYDTLEIPIVISLQGLLSQILKRYFGSLSAKDILLSHSLRALLRGRGPFFDYIRYCRAAERERRIIESAHNFIGRTQWDRAHVKGINAGASYYHANELLRPEFHQKVWSIDTICPHSIVFTNARNPIRGIETILDAIKLLKKEFPNVKLRLAGPIDTARGYGRLIRQRITTLRLDDRVEFLGYLQPDNMVDALLKSHTFCIASYVENSPNSLCEAQLLGMPCVSSYAGGIPSLVEEGKTGLFFPPGDAAVLAQRIREVFTSDSLAVSLGANARQVALSRHSPDRILSQLFNAYNACISARIE